MYRRVTVLGTSQAWSPNTKPTLRGDIVIHSFEGEDTEGESLSVSWKATAGGSVIVIPLGSGCSWFPCPLVFGNGLGMQCWPNQSQDSSGQSSQSWWTWTQHVQ